MCLFWGRLHVGCISEFSFSFHIVYFPSFWGGRLKSKGLEEEEVRNG